MIQQVPLNQLKPSPLNPRKRFDEATITELAESIAAQGLLQNLVVRLAGTKKKPVWEIAAGERRYRAMTLLVEASRLAPDYLVPVAVRELSDLQLIELATVENIGRADMHPLEEARAFQAMLDLGSDVETIAAETGLSLATVKKRLALVQRLGPEAMELVEAGEITLGQAQALTTASPDAQRRRLERARDWQGQFSLSNPASLRLELQRSAIPVSRARFPLEQYTGSFTQPSVFDERGEDTFDDVDQFHKLQDAWVQAKAKELEKTWGWVKVADNHYPSYYAKAPKGTKRDQLGVIIQHESGGEVTIHEGIYKAPTERQKASKTADGESDPRFISKRHGAVINEHRTRALQAVMLTDGRLAKAVVVTALSSTHWEHAGFHRAHTQRSEGAAHDSVLAKLEELPGTWGSPGWDSASRMAEALALSDEDLEQLFRAVVALQIRMDHPYGPERLPDQAAQALWNTSQAGSHLPTFRDLGADYLLLSSKARLEHVAGDLLDAVASDEVKGKPRKQVAGRILASAGVALDDVPPELQMPAPPKPKASRKAKVEEVEDAA